MENQTDDLSLMQKALTEIASLREAVTNLQIELDAAKAAGDVRPYPYFTDHVVHVMKKHFWHDFPEGKNPAETPVA